jgi:hypothetical protein
VSSSITSPISTPIPDDLAKIPGVVSGFRPVPINQARFVFAGRPGSGKSTLVHSNPKAFIIDPEDGSRTVDDPQAIVYQLPSNIPPGKQAEAYMKIVDTIVERKRKGKTDIEMLGIDTIDELIDIFLVDLCINHSIDDPGDYKDGHGKGYSVVGKAIFGMLDKVHRAGLGWTVIAHLTESTRRIGQEEKVIQSLGISDSFARALRRKCEHMAFVDPATSTKAAPTRTKMVGGKAIELPGKIKLEPIRVLRTFPGGLWKGESTGDIKVRVPLPDKTELPKVGGWDILTKVYDEAITTLTNPTPEGESK